MTVTLSSLSEAGAEDLTLTRRIWRAGGRNTWGGAMNKHREHLVQYLIDSAGQIIEKILSVQTETIMEVREVFPLIRDFLEDAIKQEINNYKPKTEGYDRLVDMLIELKITKSGDDTYRALIDAFNGTYRN
jgi:hypothetical protein